MSIRYEAVKYYSGNTGGDTPSEQVNGFADPAHYDTEKSPIATPGSTYVPSGSKQDLQALAAGQNTLQNVIGAVGQGLVPTASSFLGGALAGSGAYTQNILQNLAPALAGGTIDAAKQAAGALGGLFFPTPPSAISGAGALLEDTGAGTTTNSFNQTVNTDLESGP